MESAFPQLPAKYPQLLVGPTETLMWGIDATVMIHSRELGYDFLFVLSLGRHEGVRMNYRRPIVTTKERPFSPNCLKHVVAVVGAQRMVLRYRGKPDIKYVATAAKCCRLHHTAHTSLTP